MSFVPTAIDHGTIFTLVDFERCPSLPVCVCKQTIQQKQMAFITSHNGKYTLYCVVRVNSVSLAHKYTHTAAENLCVYVPACPEVMNS